MRTWLLDPHGAWAEITHAVPSRSAHPRDWDWLELADRLEISTDTGLVMVHVIDRATLTEASKVHDPWLRCRVWEFACTPGVEWVSAMWVTPPDEQAWLATMCAAADIDADALDADGPPAGWMDHRDRWLVLAGARGQITGGVDGTRVLALAT